MFWGMRYKVEIHVIKGLSPLKSLLGPISVYVWACCHGRLRKTIATGWLMSGMEKPRHLVSLRPHKEKIRGKVLWNFFLATSRTFRDIREGLRVRLQEVQDFWAQQIAHVPESLSTVFLNFLVGLCPSHGDGPWIISHRNLEMEAQSSHRTSLGHTAPCVRGRVGT